MRIYRIEEMIAFARHNQEEYLNGGRDCICQWCSASFTSKNRRIQKYCCNSCRVMSHNDRKTNWEDYTDEQLEELAY